ncbi:MAG: hypothetical protein ABEI52_02965, partial [Halobacteriaceae archaeon]
MSFVRSCDTGLRGKVQHEHRGMEDMSMCTRDVDAFQAHFPCEALLATEMDDAADPRECGVFRAFGEAQAAEGVRLCDIVGVCSRDAAWKVLSFLYVLALLARVYAQGSDEERLGRMLKRLRAASLETEAGATRGAGVQEDDDNNDEDGDETCRSLIRCVALCAQHAGGADGKTEEKREENEVENEDENEEEPQAQAQGFDELVDLMKGTRIAEIAQDLGEDLGPEMMQKINENPASMFNGKDFFDPNSPVGVIVKKLVQKMEASNMSAQDIAMEAVNLLSKISERFRPSSDRGGAPVDPMQVLMGFLGGGGMGGGGAQSGDEDLGSMLNKLTQSLSQGGACGNPMTDMLGAFLKNGMGPGGATVVKEEGGEGEEKGRTTATGNPMADLMNTVDLSSLDLAKMMSGVRHLQNTLSPQMQQQQQR